MATARGSVRLVAGRPHGVTNLAPGATDVQCQDLACKGLAAGGRPAVVPPWYTQNATTERSGRDHWPHAFMVPYHLGIGSTRQHWDGFQQIRRKLSTGQPTKDLG